MPPCGGEGVARGSVGEGALLLVEEHPPNHDGNRHESRYFNRKSCCVHVFWPLALACLKSAIIAWRGGLCIGKFKCARHSWAMLLRSARAKTHLPPMARGASPKSSTGLAFSVSYGSLGGGFSRPSTTSSGTVTQRAAKNTSPMHRYPKTQGQAGLSAIAVSLATQR